MTRTLVGLLVILLVHGQTNGFISIIDVKSLIAWGDAIFSKGMEIYGAEKTLFGTDSEKIEDSLKKLNKISSELKEFTSRTDLKLDNLLKTLLTNLRVSISLQPMKTELNNHINTIKRFYNDAEEYSAGNSSYTVDTLRNFAHLVLSTSDNLPATLLKIHELLTNPNRQGYLQLLLHDAQDNLQHDCNKNVSAQQEMYYTYSSVLVAEMKGLAVLSQVYLIKQTFDAGHHNYTNELRLAKERYKTRLMDYKNIIPQHLSQFPREIYRCEVNPPEREINFIELYEMVEAWLWHVRTVAEEIGLIWHGSVCRVRCSHLTDNGDRLYQNRLVLSNCKWMGRMIEGCWGDKDSHHEYSWWKNGGTTYGRENTCKNKFVMDGEVFYPSLTSKCAICVCTTYKYPTNTTRVKTYLNFDSQLSDIENNMVVTGVRFVKSDNIISLQIQQNKFLPGGLSDNTGSWKNITYRAYSYLFYYHTRFMHLDDIILPDKYAVTGIQFKSTENTSCFVLRVHGTPLDINTGILDGTRSRWFEANDGSTLKSRDYKRSRVKIDMGDADEPTRGSVFNYDSETNKCIKFTHTSLEKDAGRTTIPYIETLPVESMSTFPLGGIGLWYRGRNGFGGYIAPRIYTMDVSKYIETL